MVHQKKSQPKGKKREPNANSRVRRQSRQSAARTEQREWLRLLRDEVDYLDDLSVIVMSERGILPPFYGGVDFADQTEAIPLWGIDENGEEDLGLLFLRVVPEIEMAASLRAARAEISLSNDLAISDVFASIQAIKPINIEGGEDLADQMITLALSGSQIDPAPGQTLGQTRNHVQEGLPFAAFLHIPVVGDPSSNDEDAFDYNWDELENYRIEILCADSPDDLEVAVWKYRLDLALSDELVNTDSTPSDDSEDTLPPFLNAAELVAIFDLMVLDGVRFYGVTSPVRAKQAALDILREEDDVLVVRPPIKPEVEPVRPLAEHRIELQEGVQKILSEELPLMSPTQDTPILRIEPWSEQFRRVWTDVRAHPYFALLIHKASLKLSSSGKLLISGYSSAPSIEWIIADSLPALYEQVTLFSLQRMLAVFGYVPQLIESENDLNMSDETINPADRTASASDIPKR